MVNNRKYKLKSVKQIFFYKTSLKEKSLKIQIANIPYLTLRKIKNTPNTAIFVKQTKCVKIRGETLDI